MALPTRYFSKLDHNGRFKIENVPAGRWTIKLWHRDGWANLPGRSVEVPGKDVKIDQAHGAPFGILVRIGIDALAPQSAVK